MTLHAQQLPPSPPPSPEESQGDVETLRQQQQRLMELLGTRDPGKLEHDVRNVLNELNLLRKLAELDGE
jgi:hypothetical protein